MNVSQAPTQVVQMFENYPRFAQPKNPDVKIWRYMDFAKFVSLLDSSSLYFARTDKLGDDPFEGSWPRQNVRQRDYVPNGLPTEVREYFAKCQREMWETNQEHPKFMAISCWHMNQHESAAMWKLYLKNCQEGIALQTTYRKLQESLTNSQERILLGLVRYIDYETEGFDDNYLLDPFIHKRKNFEHENEVRAIVVKGNASAEGVKIRVDLERLIERIYVSPSAPRWFAELTSSVANKYGYSFLVEPSRLDESPLF